jgi:predicted nuclease of predicted toxin-antitoxin system
MKLLLDQNLSAAAAELLRASGTDVFHTREVGLATAADADILEWCREQGRILIRRVIEMTEGDLTTGSAVTVNARSIRVHRLPLGLK